MVYIITRMPTDDTMVYIITRMLRDGFFGTP